MGYHIKFLRYKKSAPQWKVQYISFKKSDTQNSKAKKPKREWDIPKTRWPALGFNAFMTIQEAKARAKQLNSQLHLKRQEERLRKIDETQACEQRRYDSVLPPEFTAEFELRFVRQRDSQTIQGLRKNTRSYTVWRAAQKMIAAIGVEPSDWFYHSRDIYDYFFSQRYSIKYASRILYMANLWGFYICRKMARPFLAVPMPRGFERQRLIEANNEKAKGVSRASLAITPLELTQAKSALNQESFNWIFLSVWFGLRPKEIDDLKSAEFWKIEILFNGRKILWIYQTKVVALPPEHRWKPIPILFEEQEFALKIIKDGNFSDRLRRR